jgi:hypothetical protein
MTEDEFKFLKLCEETLEKLERFQEFRTEFKTNIINDVCKIFMELNTHRYTFPFKEFNDKCLVDLDLLAENFCLTFGNIYDHYLNNTTKYFEVEDVSVNYTKKEFPQEEIEDLKNRFPDALEQIDEYVKNANREYLEEYNYVVKFNHVIKKFITDYIIDADHFTGRAYREIEFLCNIYYSDFNDELFTIADKMQEEYEKNKAEI